MNLAHLSIVRLSPIGRVPHTPTPEERLAAYRAVVPPVFANNYPWKWRQSFDPNPPSLDEVQEGFAHKYGPA